MPAMAQGDATVEIHLENDRFESENVPKDTTEQVTPELLAVLQYAHCWSLPEKRRDGRTLTFSSTLAALMASDKPLCRWLQRHLGLRGVAPKEMTKAREVEIKDLPARYPTTESFRTALEAARTLRGPDARQPIDVRHLMAAYAVAPDYHLGDFLRLKIDRRAWCLDLADRLRELYPDEQVRWKAYATLAPPVPGLDFTNDAPTGRDLLNIDREVEAFARLIAARTTSTPLSIGVFGAWGSGKSFFMRRVRDRVATLAETGRTEGRTSAFHGRVAQVEFNAWHYSEGSLVACLVDHILRNLRISEDEDAAALRRRSGDLVAQLDRAKQGLADREHGVEEAEARREAEQRKVEQIEAQLPNEIALKQRELDAAKTELAGAQDMLARAKEQQQKEVDAATAKAPAMAALAVFRKGIANENLAAADKAITELITEVKSVGAQWVPIILGLVVLGIGLVVAQVVGSKTYAHVISAITALGTVAATATGWLRKLRAIADRGKEFQAAQAKIADEAARSVEAAHKPKLDALEAVTKSHVDAVSAREKELAGLRDSSTMAKAELERLVGQRAEAVAARDRAASEVAARREALASFSSGTLLGEFLDERASSDGYRKNLTIFTQVRNDFERLSRLMERATTEYYDHEKPAPPVSRIVLYIDDLDRCPEEKVIEVLRTVHLLLAFPLFVCVVAVDPRWVTACLWKAPGLVSRDGWQLGTDGTRVRAEDSTKAQRLERTFGKPATPADFLEKIFQIPLWLRPVPPEQRPDLVRALLDPDFRVTRAQTTRPVALVEPKEDEVKKMAGTMVLVPRGPHAEGGYDAMQAAKAHEVIDAAELDYLGSLGGVLDGNPRALKRFVNTYRLVKSALSDVELAVFRSPSLMCGDNKTEARYLPYRLCMTQLAVLCTQRERALRMVGLADATTAGTKLDTWLKRLESNDDKPLAECFRAALERDVSALDDVTFETFALWLERTRRYSFYL
jgi:hypothetical protein